MTGDASKVFGDQYLGRLRAYFEEDPDTGLDAAHALGTGAVAIGLETLDLAKIHEAALALLLPPDGSSSTLANINGRASRFFTEAITPIEGTHSVALKSITELNQLIERLESSTQALEDSHRELQVEINERQLAEAALKASEQAALEVISESRHLEKQRQDIARKILTANEKERTRASLMLQDEIAQTLLGLEVRLLALKNKVVGNHYDLNKEISTIRRLVETSAVTISHLTREFGIRHEQ